MLSEVISILKDEMSKNENKKIIGDLAGPYISELRNSIYLLIFLQILILCCSIFYLVKFQQAMTINI